MPQVRLSVCLVIAAFAIALAPLLRAQTRPNFVGKWTLVPERSAPATPEPHQREITIAQDAQTVTLTQFGYRITVTGGVPSTPPREDFQYSTTYECDGTEHPTPKPTPPAAPTTVAPTTPPGAVVVTSTIRTDSTYRAIWTRDQLVIITRRTSTFTPSNAAASSTGSFSRKALSLDAEGLLVVDNITISDPTPNGPTQAAPVPVRSVYRKAS